MSLVVQFQHIIKQQHLFSPKDKLLLAVSGGVDSVVLCELCKQSGFDFMIAHCNFQLRGEESERDEQFVRGLGKKYNVAVVVEKFDTATYATQHKLSIQETARELRYTWFEKLLIPDSGFSTLDYVLTAHHADDNAETVLMNFFRGTGLHGLTGIPEANSYIRRPLLSFKKQELIQFAAENDLAFVEDSSNQLSKYTRNFFRNELIPEISKVYPQVKENLQDNIRRFKEIEKLYQFSVAQVKKKLCKQKGVEIHIPVKQLMGFHNLALIYEIIKDYGFAEKQVDELAKLSASDTGKFIISPDNTHRIIKHRHWFIISPVHSTAAENIIIEEKDKNILFSGRTIRLEGTSIINCKLQATKTIACLDLKEIKFPLLLRKWKTGDYFYPLGMKKKKKLSRFFIDQKLSKTEKENAWVIESNKKIIWVVDHRIDERFKITDKTQKVLRLTTSH
ncbi:MAG TPA: tRNA lysidine(34) synthetase TilS [Chitinophagaceae bacterium]